MQTRPVAKRSILIVDDNPEKTLALQSVVEELQHTVVIATSADAALRELLKQDFALALLDVHMPKMDGFELAALIRSRPAHQNLAIVFMSSLDQTDARLEHAYELGAIDFIALPARGPLIKAKLSSLLGLQEKAHRLEIFAEESARRVEHPDERFRLLLEKSEDVAIFFLDAAGNVAEWSHAAELCTGWSAGEIVGQAFSVFFVPGDVADQVPRDLLKASRNEPCGIAERWLVRRNGARFWARFQIVGLGGRPDAGFGILLRDVSGQKTTEQELQIKAEVLDSMSESVCVVNEDLRILYVNPAAGRTFGYDLSELVGCDVRILSACGENEADALVANLQARFKHSRQWAGEWRSRRKDGSLFLTHTRLSMFQHQGLRYFVCVQEDLTVRRQAEAAMQRSAELQEVVTELEAFSYSISHDIRSPLRSLRGFADAVIHDYGEVLKGPGLHHMERIRHATERLEKMVEDILTVSRLPREALPLAAVDLNRLLADLVEDTPQFRPPAAQITLAGTLPRVLGHEPSLRQVFHNLLGNAVKFVPSGREPTISIGADITASDVVVWVDDNGIGVKPEDHERIFQVFERVESAGPFPGTGVGLAIVKRMIERLGGSVGVGGRAQGGSRFWIKLKLAPHAAG